MRTSLRRDLTAALKARDRVKIVALCSVLAAIENAEAPPINHLEPKTDASEYIAGSVVGQGAAEVERCHLTGSDLRTIVETEMDERSVAARGHEQNGRRDLARRLRAEADVLSRYLPQSRY